MFFTRIDWAGSMDQLSTAWAFDPFSLVASAERSVAALS